MHRKYFILIVIITLLSLLFIIYSFETEETAPIQIEHIIQPPQSPFTSYISGIGVIEPKSGNILIAASVNRVVEKIFVKVGEQVKRGDILFQLENRDLKADKRVQQMAYKSAMAKMQRLEALPHPEDIAASKASLNSVKSELDEAERQYQMVLNLPDIRAISQEEADRRRYRAVLAKEKYNEAKAQFQKLNEGSWKPDLEIAHYEALHAKANLIAIETEIERTTIRSPIAGTILQLKIHEGEYSQANPRTPLMIIGDTSELYLRVNINQLEVAYFSSEAPAVAFLQGDAQLELSLEFIRVEPFLVTKEEITNEVSEKVDTRTFQIIYKIKNSPSTLFTGARMDVFIERKPR